MDATPATEQRIVAGGYVLAGGRSSRMGRDKSRLPWGGTTLIETIAAEIAVLGTAPVATVGGVPVAGLRYVEDPLSGYGPVAGIAAALRDARQPWILAVACDMPGIRADFLRTLLQAAEGSGAIPVTPDGRMHPLCAVWSATALRSFERALEAGEHRLRRVVSDLQCVFVPVDEPGLLRNVNTPEEYAAALAQTLVQTGE